MSSSLFPTTPKELGVWLQLCEDNQSNDNDNGKKNSINKKQIKSILLQETECKQI